MGKILKTTGIIILVVILIAAGVGFYFYNFHVFKTLRLCITEDSNDTKVSCSSDQECIDYFTENADELSQAIGNTEELLGFAQEKITEAVEATIFCEQTCKIKEIRGLEQIGDIKECFPSEKEIKIEIRGKEGLQIWGYLRKNN